MPLPIDYTVDVQSPFQAATQGLQLGGAISQIQQNQAALAAKRKMNEDIAAFSAKENPSAGDYAGIISQYPQLSEDMERGFKILNTEQRQNKLSQATKVFAALQSNRPDIAIEQLGEQATALRNAGDERGAKTLDDYAELVKFDPKGAKIPIGLMLSSVAGPEKFAETFAKLGAEQRAVDIHPAKTKEAQAKADKAATEAGFAESEAVADLSKKGWDISKIASDIEISKENAKIAAANSVLKRTQDKVKQSELKGKIEDMKVKRDDLARKKTADLESGRSNIDNMVNTIDRLLKNPSLDDVIGSIEGRLPSVFSDEGSDAIALIDTLKSQAFLSQIPNLTGMGALSDAEGKKIESSIQNLDRVQSENQFKKNLKEIQRLVLKGRANLSTRFGAPETIPDTPEAAQTSAEEIDALVTKYTRGR